MQVLADTLDELAAAQLETAGKKGKRTGKRKSQGHAGDGISYHRPMKEKKRKGWVVVCTYVALLKDAILEEGYLNDGHFLHSPLFPRRRFLSPCQCCGVSNEDRTLHSLDSGYVHMPIPCSVGNLFEGLESKKRLFAQVFWYMQMASFPVTPNSFQNSYIQTPA